MYLIRVREITQHASTHKITVRSSVPYLDKGDNSICFLKQNNSLTRVREITQYFSSNKDNHGQ